MDTEANQTIGLPDDDIVPYEPNPATEQGNYVFVSHTLLDESFLKREVASLASERHLVFHMVNKNSSAADLYKRRILSSLSICAWFIVVVSDASVESKWVRFEVSWAMSYRRTDRVIVLLTDNSDPASLNAKLHGAMLIEYRKNIVEARRHLMDALPDYSGEHMPE